MTERLTLRALPANPIAWLPFPAVTGFGPRQTTYPSPHCRVAQNGMAMHPTVFP